MQAIKFSYRDADGRESVRTLTHWSENTRYLQGRSEGDTLPRTFRKDRVVEYLEGADQLLFDKAPPAPEPAPKAAPDLRAQILFTGFKAAERAALEVFAEQSGFRVMKTAGKSLALLCIGSNAGPTKVEAARAAGAFILNEMEFNQLAKTGELPA
ncbi:BRCT domain-containing protein [Ectopseudomonas toyotomiensis]|uniref:BRCT domain-containing protein n=1 Tax=Ectopseudomonas toyotomiensis TaxID=554344 RepID=UPI003D0BDA64